MKRENASKSSLNIPTFKIQNRFDYDFAILELTTPIKITGDSKARAVCLPNPKDNKFEPGTNFTTSGWGLLCWGPTCNQAVKLHRVTVPSVSDAQCKTLHKDAPFSITPRMHCAGDLKKDGVGSCRGDSGGKNQLNCLVLSHY